MANETQKLTAILNPPPQSTGANEASKGGLSAILSTVREVGGKIWDEASPTFEHGNAELAAALFNPNGSAFVMYGHKGKQDQAPDNGQSVEAMKQPEVQKEQSIEREM